jgi:hypothetical protein
MKTGLGGGVCERLERWYAETIDTADVDDACG